MACAGLSCHGYENDGVCNVPRPCAIGSDCADCKTLFPTYQLVTTIVSFLMMVLLLVIVCIRLCTNQAKRSHANSVLLQSVNE